MISDLAGLFLVRSVTGKSITLGSGSYINSDINVFFDGYTPLGVVGYASGSAVFFVASARLNDFTVHMVIGANSGNTTGTPSVTVLYTKDS